MVEEDSDDLGPLIKLPKIDLQKDRYRYIKGYKIDRWIITAFEVLCFGYLFFIAYHYDFNMNYFSCGLEETWGKSYYNKEDYCKNYFYEPATWINEKELPPGQYGMKPGPLFKSAIPVTILIFIVGFLVNHLVHHRRKIEGIL